MDSKLSEMSNPALDAARAELKDIATNPDNPRYAGYQRGNAQVSAYLDGLYKKACPETPPPDTPTTPASLREPEQDNTMTLEDRAAQTEVEEMLRRSFGDDFDTQMRDMRVGGGYLFGTKEQQTILETLSQLITDLGPLAQVRGIRFLAEIGQLVNNHKGGRT